MNKLDQFRGQIDRVDDQVLSLLVQRARLARKIGQVKTKLGDFTVPADKAVLIHEP